MSNIHYRESNKMHIFPALIALTILCGPAFSQCATPDDTFLSCTFSGGKKAVHVCVDGSDMTYSFGRVGAAPELVLSVPVIDVEYVPWPGVSSIFESVRFSNGDISYVANGGFTRIYPENENDDIIMKPWGSIDVFEDWNDPQTEKELAVLECDEGSVSFTYGGSIYDAKKAANQCWDMDVRRWETCQ